MFNKMKHASGGKKFAIILFFAIAFTAFIATVIWVVMTLWNSILTEVVSGIKPVTYWQAAGLLLLSKILFSGFGKGGRKGSWKKRSQHKLKTKWMNMKPEKREEMKSRWKAYCEKRKTSE